MTTGTEKRTNRAHLAAGKPPAGKNVRARVTHEFPAVYDRDSRVLLLGSIPSPKSREVGFYYGHPQNRFWKVLAAVLGEKIPETIPQKKAMLKRHHIALWDVIASCEIMGSADSTIQKHRGCRPEQDSRAGGKVEGDPHILYGRHCAQTIPEVLCRRCRHRCG